MNILLVEDDADLAGMTGAYLEAHGHVIHYAQNGKMGLNLAACETVDAVILDIMLPDLDGYEVCHRLRQNDDRQLPILMLTARDTVQDKLKGFHSGADDYLVKPFSMLELQARLESLYKRARFSQQARILRVADIEFNQDTLQVRRGTRHIELQPTPRKILQLLMRASHRVISLSELEDYLWPNGEPDRDALRVHIHSLRKAIDGPDDKPLLKTIRGIGYRLSDDPD